jgi:hypothetical protein
MTQVFIEQLLHVLLALYQAIPIKFSSVSTTIFQFLLNFWGVLNTLIVVYMLTGQKGLVIFLWHNFYFGQNLPGPGWLNELGSRIT